MDSDLHSTARMIREHCRVDGEDIGVFHRGSQWDYCALAQVFSERQYEIPGVFHRAAFDFHQNVLSAGNIPLIVDAGANIGAASLYFSFKWHPCHIISVEPDPSNFEVLQKNLAHRSANLHHAGIDWQDGQGVLTDPGRGELGYQTSQYGEGPRVQMLGLRSILSADKEGVPFILKIDIEGAEHSLFSADTASASRFPVVIFEPHDWMMPGHGTSVPFFRWHAAQERELAFGGENIFSFDVKRLKLRD